LKTNFPTTILSLFILLFLSACTQGPEPKLFDAVIIKNSTGETVRYLRLSATIDGSMTPVGAVAPLPVGTSYIFKRPSNAFRLPEKLEASWVSGAGRTNNAILDISKYFEHANRGKTLVFDLQANGDFNITVR
jgi:hypothetical protein